MHCSDYRPPWPLLKDSLRKRSREFVRENSLHVVPYFIDPSRPIYERAMWFVVFLLALAATCLTIVVIWQKFQTSPTLTYLYIERENSTADFPNVYLCFDGSHLNFSKVHPTPKQLEMQLSMYRWKGEPLDFGYDDDDGVIGYRQYFLDLAPKCGDFFFDCRFGKRPFKCGDLFTQKIATPDGICCEFKSRPIDKDDPPWSLQFRPSQYPISVHITGKSDGPPLYGQQSVHKMSGPTSIQLRLTITSTASSVRFLTRSQRKCAFADEGPSHVDCERKRIARTMESTCGCLPWFHAGKQSEECSISYGCLALIDTTQIPVKGCYISCDKTAYGVEKAERLYNGDGSEISFLTWPEVRFRRATRFGWLDLLVSFGGVAGFFLGYSVIASVEGLYYFTLRAYCGAVLAKPRSRFNVAVRQARKAEVKDSKELRAERGFKGF